MADIVLINPRFDISYWGFEHALPFLGKKANMPVACLPLLAALTPAEHKVTILDENVEPIDYQGLEHADIIGLTGLNVQRVQMRKILAELKRRGHFVVVGGAWVTVQEDYFGELADVIFVGEAEETWPQFLSDWKHGKHQRRYEQAESTDMSKVPVPRFDLVDMRNYAFGTVQFSRGCPFQCEFCDIIVTFGRRPRLKTSAQVIAELEALRAQKVKMLFIVDDNLIGNKKAIKLLLRDVIAWQQAEGYPLIFSTEASLDLAEDPELLRLMDEANIVSVFVGIESPNEDSLKETKKYQNVKKGRSILERVHAIQEAGIEVWSGMIVGFDHDDESIFARQREFLRQSRITHALIGMLFAIPKTPLYKRLAEEGRLDPHDQSEFGTNIIPLRMSREALRDGYIHLLNDLYEPAAFFERLEDLYLRQRLDYGRGRARYWRQHPWQWFKAQAANLVAALFLYHRFVHGVPNASLRKEYHRRIMRLLRVRRDPEVLLMYLIKSAIHYHHHTMARQMANGLTRVVSSL